MVRQVAQPAGVQQAYLGRGQVLLMAVATGVVAANLYYAQPLLHAIGTAFGIGAAASALSVTVTQVAFAFGLFLVVPVGDLLNRQRLISVLLAVIVGGMVLAALAPNVTIFYVAMAIVGSSCIAAQVIVPMAADLASPEHRGEVVGTVMSGLLVGILLARTISGIVAGAAGWRAVYWMGAALTATLIVVLRFALPADRAPRGTLGYRALLVSTVRIFAAERELRHRAVLGLAGFAAFSILWSTLAFLLASAPYGYSSTVIGLFGLVGAAGALCARPAGRFVDAGRSGRTTVLFLLAIISSLVLMAAGKASLVLVIFGVLLLDVGVQGLHITNQSVIYRLRADARSRVNAAYMVMYFVGGAVGSAVGGVAYQYGGFAGACGVGAAIAFGALVLVGYERARTARRQPGDAAGLAAGA